MRAQHHYHEVAQEVYDVGADSRPWAFVRHPSTTLLMLIGVQVAIAMLILLSFVSTTGVATGVFVGVLLLSYATSCTVAWASDGRAQRKVSQIDKLVRHRGSARGNDTAR